MENIGHCSDEKISGAEDALRKFMTLTDQIIAELFTEAEPDMDVFAIGHDDLSNFDRQV